MFIGLYSLKGVLRISSILKDRLYNTLYSTAKSANFALECTVRHLISDTPTLNTNILGFHPKRVL